MVLKLLENTFVSQRIEFVHFHSCPQAKLSPKESFLKIYFSPAEREDYGAKIWPKKLNLKGSLVTSFDIFHHLQPLHFWLQFCCAMI